MVQLGSHFTLLLTLCLAVAARPATTGVVAEHEASFKHTRRFHRVRIHRSRYDDGQRHPGYPTATSDEGDFDLTYPTAPRTDEQHVSPSQSPSATQDTASSIYAADGRYHPGYMNATYDNVQIHAGPTTYNNEKYAPQTADQASPSSNSSVAVKTLVVAIAELPTLSALLATSSPTTTSTSATDIPAHTTTTTSPEGFPTEIQKLVVPVAAAAAPTNPTTATPALSGAVGFAAGIFGQLIPTGTPTGIPNVRLGVSTSTTSTTSGDTEAATATSTTTHTTTTPGAVPPVASIAGGVMRLREEDPIYHVGKSRQKRVNDGQYHPGLGFDNKNHHPGKSHGNRFDDGQDLSDPKFEDSQYHSNGHNGDYHLRKDNQKLSDDDRYHPSSISDDGKHHSGKRMNRRVPVA